MLIVIISIVIFVQMAEIAIDKRLFSEILARIWGMSAYEYI